jgi:hypothetical protein
MHYRRHWLWLEGAALKLGVKVGHGDRLNKHAERANLAQCRDSLQSLASQQHAPCDAWQS